MKNVSDILKVDCHQVSNVLKQYQRRFERNENVNLEIASKQHYEQKKFNVEEPMKRLQQAPLSSLARNRIMASAIGIPKKIVHKNMETLVIQMFSRSLKPVLSRKTIDKN